MDSLSDVVEDRNRVDEEVERGKGIFQLLFGHVGYVLDVGGKSVEDTSKAVEALFHHSVLVTAVELFLNRVENLRYIRPILQ